tara:strand:+ start:212 stop:904 length:693 start_codon:yes stop_codon:yes gene_type:complete
MNSDTTNISELPVQPGTTGGEAQNIVMTTNEKQSTTYSPNVPGLNNSSAPASTGPPAPQNGQGAVQGQPQMQQSQPPPQMTKEMMSQFNGELKNANENNLTQLPTRDVPMNPLLHVQDDQSKPNHVPQENNAPDYIKQFNNIENTIKQNNENVEQNNFMDNIYDEIQTPLLIFILFFIFQLPSVSKEFNRQFPILLSNDSSLTLKGFIVKSFIVALLYFLINKGITQISL